MIRKFPHVGLRLPDMAERSMPEQDGLTWQTPEQKVREHLDRVMALAEMAGAFVPPRTPIRVVAEVGEAIPEIEGS